MKYRVSVVRALAQFGHVEIESESPEDARKAVEHLLTLKGSVVKRPVWGEVAPGSTHVTGVEAA